jgi:hypothetical protein
MTGRYEEEFYGQTSIGYPSQSYRDSQLGSGFMFPDEQTKVKEWAINSSRIEGWRRTRSYRYWREVGGVCGSPRRSHAQALLTLPRRAQDFNAWIESPFAIPNMDIQHQLLRLRNAKTMSESEAATIYKSLAESVTTYPQIIEVSYVFVDRLTCFGV